jgi:hypothetical protein
MRRFNKIYVVDLDNTLYDTWPSLISRPRGFFYKISPLHELIRVFRIRAFSKMLCLLRRRLGRNDIVFLSARHNFHYPATVCRLIYELRSTSFKLILVRNAIDKIPVITEFSESYRKVVVIDDLSYGHESGLVSSYTDVVDCLSALGVKIITRERLARLQT